MESYTQITTRIIDEIKPLFAGSESIRIHGDCHTGNLIYRPGESFYLIDFDDMAIGPPVQDFWMLLPGPLDESFVAVDLLLEGYETFRPFDRTSLRLIEPLRAMRLSTIPPGARIRWLRMGPPPLCPISVRASIGSQRLMTSLTSWNGSERAGSQAAMICFRREGKPGGIRGKV